MTLGLLGELAEQRDEAVGSVLLVVPTISNFDNNGSSLGPVVRWCDKIRVIPCRRC